MSDKQEQDGSAESAEAAMKAAFARLGIVLDEENGGDAEMQVAALNGVADRLDAITAERDAAHAKLLDLDVITAELETVKAGAAETDRDLASHVVQLRDANIELLSLRRQVAAQKGQATRAKAEQAETAEKLAEAVARSGQTEPRVLPGARPVLSRIDRPTVMALVADADKVEIVPVADDREEIGLGVLVVSGGVDAFVLGRSGIGLSVDRWEVTGPGKVTGWALYLDGELAAYRDRSGGQLTIGNHQTFNLASDVLF
ncbi:hypothetical protein [Novosphingobium guangzhouense]|uniref:Uncharacterized protein n=1 Tax=Novosphingobium guangzhouense TaxID=1850347 RepID=A0A2K2G439_9SPHN|nr:hypothetical protein [Novosphingobium guangzhouense]PNU05815.1 hypothetical protein A8V01_14715 [Novosphingobium guangzhouense]